MRRFWALDPFFHRSIRAKNRPPVKNRRRWRSASKRAVVVTLQRTNHGDFAHENRICRETERKSCNYAIIIIHLDPFIRCKNFTPPLKIHSSIFSKSMMPVGLRPFDVPLGQYQSNQLATFFSVVGESKRLSVQTRGCFSSTPTPDPSLTSSHHTRPAWRDFRFYSYAPL